jgi:hypothetical protein
METWFYPLYTRFLERATEGILLLDDRIGESGCSETLRARMHSMIGRITSRERGKFAAQAASLITELKIVMDDIDVSDCFNRALQDESLIRLERFCFLTAALIVRYCTA